MRAFPQKRKKFARIGSHWVSSHQPHWETKACVRFALPGPVWNEMVVHTLRQVKFNSVKENALAQNCAILLWWSHQKGPGAAKSTQSYQLGFFGLVDPISVTFHFFYLRPAWTIYHSGHCKTFFLLRLKAPKQSSVSLLPSLFKGWTFFLSVNILMDVELDWGQSISHYCHYPASMKVWFRCRVSAVDQAIPENRELKKKIEFSFFRQTSIVDKFWHFL